MQITAFMSCHSGQKRELVSKAHDSRIIADPSVQDGNDVTPLAPPKQNPPKNLAGTHWHQDCGSMQRDVARGGRASHIQPLVKPHPVVEPHSTRLLCMWGRDGRQLNAVAPASRLPILTLHLNQKWTHGTLSLQTLEHTSTPSTKSTTPHPTQLHVLFVFLTVPWARSPLVSHLEGKAVCLALPQSFATTFGGGIPVHSTPLVCSIEVSQEHVDRGQRCPKCRSSACRRISPASSPKLESGPTMRRLMGLFPGPANLRADHRRKA